MTGLRHRGCQLEKLETHYSKYKQEFNLSLERQILKANVVKGEGRVRLTQFGKLISDRVISDFFATE